MKAERVTVPMRWCLMHVQEDLMPIGAMPIDVKDLAAGVMHSAIRAQEKLVPTREAIEDYQRSNVERMEFLGRLFDEIG